MLCSSRCSRTGARLDSSDLEGLVEGNVPDGGTLGDLQVLEAALKGGGGGECCLMDSI